MHTKRFVSIFSSGFVYNCHVGSDWNPSADCCTWVKQVRRFGGLDQWESTLRSSYCMVIHSVMLHFFQSKLKRFSSETDRVHRVAKGVTPCGFDHHAITRGKPTPVRCLISASDSNIYKVKFL